MYDYDEYIVKDKYCYLKNYNINHLILSQNTKTININTNCQIRKISISSATVIIKLLSCGLEEIDAIEELTQKHIYILDVRGNKIKTNKINIPIIEYYE